MTSTDAVGTPIRAAVDPLHVTFARVVRSEWIKFITVRSTVWTLSITLLVMVGLSLLVAATASAEAGPGGGGPSGAEVATAGYLFAQMVVAVLGALVITGEYSTGMIRSTLTAVPTRLPVLAGKAVVLALATFVVGVSGALIAAIVTRPVLTAGEPADLGSVQAWRMLLGTGLYLAGIALLAFGLGVLIRHSAGAITSILGVILLLPLLVNILGGALTWVAEAGPYLPADAGARILAPEPEAEALAAAEAAGVTLLGPWQGYGILLVYVAVTLVAGAALLRRRDA